MDKESQVDVNQLFLDARNDVNFQLIDAVQSLEATIRKLYSSQSRIRSYSGDRKKRTSLSALEKDKPLISKPEKVRYFSVTHCS